MQNTEYLVGYAELYRALAETLSEPPAWFSESGAKWPLFSAALAVISHRDNPAIRRALSEISEIAAESATKRQQRYAELFLGRGRTPIGLYESLLQDGRLAGPTMFAVDAIYKTVGLEVPGAELADHASVELSFISFLLEQQSKATGADANKWQKARKLFIERHAGQWLPGLGDALSRSGDKVYGPLGHLLSGLLRRELRPQQKPLSKTDRGLPVLSVAEECTLCSFCVQSCPTDALLIAESNTETTLLVKDVLCVGCGRCVDVCTAQVLQLEAIVAVDDYRQLRQSVRASCTDCGQPLVSEAELEAIYASIGKQSWLAYCQDCR